MTNSTNDQTQGASILKRLRSLIPTRDCTFDETLTIAERQAAKLSDLIAAADPDSDGVDLCHIEDMPRIRVVFERLPVSGMSYWNATDRHWVLAVSGSDSPARQRFTLFHEFKHIIDHGQTARLYRGDRHRSATQQAEAAADYFAGCALVPRRHLKSAWGRGIQRIYDLAGHFGVSEHAIRVRLSQTGLDRITDAPAARCARPVSTPRGYQQRFRIPPTSYPRVTP